MTTQEQVEQLERCAAWLNRSIDGWTPPQTTAAELAAEAEQMRPAWISRAMAAASDKPDKAELNRRAIQHLLSHPRAGYREVARAIGTTDAIARKLPACMKKAERRKQAKAGGVKAVGLSDALAASVSDDHDEIAEIDERLDREAALQKLAKAQADEKAGDAGKRFRPRRKA